MINALLVISRWDRPGFQEVRRVVLLPFLPSVGLTIVGKVRTTDGPLAEEYGPENTVNYVLEITAVEWDLSAQELYVACNVTDDGDIDSQSPSLRMVLASDGWQFGGLG